MIVRFSRQDDDSKIFFFLCTSFSGRRRRVNLFSFLRRVSLLSFLRRVNFFSAPRTSFSGRTMYVYNMANELNDFRVDENLQLGKSYQLKASYPILVASGRIL